MTYTAANLHNQVAHEVNKAFYSGVPAATLTTELTAMATSVDAETKVHDVTIESYITPSLNAGQAPDRWQSLIGLVLNRGFGGNLSAATIGAQLTAISAGPFPIPDTVTF